MCSPQGMNWLTQTKRIAIYLRDDLSCTYCGKGIEQGAKLSLDHLQVGRVKGNNHHTNLVTCCYSCNSSRQATPLKIWVKRISGKGKYNAAEIMLNIKELTRRDLPLSQAKRMILRRGSAIKAVQSLTK